MRIPSFWWLPFGKVPEIPPVLLRRWLKEGKPIQLVDSRTSLEYNQGRIDGAHLATVTDLPGAIDRLNLDPTRPVVVICLSGHRSRPGTRLLRGRGYEAYSLQGGMLAWWQMKKNP